MHVTLAVHLLCTPAIHGACARSTTLRMGGGIKQPRPKAPFDTSAVPAVAPGIVAAGGTLPRMIVFDLDNTVWTPELYTLRHLPGYARAGPPNPVAGKDVWLLDGAAAALHELATCACWRGASIAVASRTNKGGWARSLLSQFEVPGTPGRKLDVMLSHRQIFTGSKVSHFEALRAESGLDYSEMLFFDDAGFGKFGNCEVRGQQAVAGGYSCFHKV